MRASSCAMRRGDPVPTRAPCGQGREGEPVAGAERVAGIRALRHRAERGGPRARRSAGLSGSARPRRTSPRSSASRSAAANTPVPPSEASEAREVSPSVVIGHELDLGLRGLGEPLGDRLRLGHRERARAGADADDAGRSRPARAAHGAIPASAGLEPEAHVLAASRAAHVVPGAELGDGGPLGDRRAVARARARGRPGRRRRPDAMPGVGTRTAARPCSPRGLERLVVEVPEHLHVVADEPERHDHDGPARRRPAVRRSRR